MQRVFNPSAIPSTVASQQQNSAVYTFRQPPQAFQHPVYRDPATAAFASSSPATGGGTAVFASSASRKYGNIMYDRRVYRGNTYGSPVLSSSAKAEQQHREMSEHQRRKQASQRAASIKRRKQVEAARRALSTPEPVEGRRHVNIQTEEYLEELVDKVETQCQETQTDPLLDRPPTPPYISQKTGHDAETQIHEGDLFNFDDAVEPILEVLVGKTMEQAMLEVMQEDELELLRQQQLEFEQRRKEELLEAQRLESEEKRKFEEKERRKRQEMERIQREKETREKLQARQFAKAYVTNLENRVFARLQDEGWFADRVKNEIELEFFPWLMSEVDKELGKKNQARELVDALIRQVVDRNLELVARSYEAARQRILQKEQQQEN